MVNINWDEFKAFKQHSHKDDNFLILLAFEMINAKETKKIINNSNSLQ